jgi:hypothetical protein
MRHLFEIREQAGRIPSLRTDVRPRVIVGRSSAVVDHAIDTTSTSDQFCLGERNPTVAKFSLRGCLNVPCIFESVRNPTGCSNVEAGNPNLFVAIIPITN